MKKNIDVVFFGTHEFAANILEGLIKSPFVDVKLVITQPDRPVGRKQKLQKSLVKLLAEKYNIQVEQPESLKDYRLRTTDFGLSVVAQYGLLIPKKILEFPKHGTINIHTSLLPKYRGASPIQSALINGETKTGVTIMLMDEGLDTGPILLQKTINIEPNDTYTNLDGKLAKLGLQALLDAIPAYIAGNFKSNLQDESQVTICKKLTREDGKIDWNKTAQEIYNLYRGLNPWPGVWTVLDKKRLKLLNIKFVEKKLKTGQIHIENDKLYIGCKKDAIEIFELQLEGKKEMDVKTFVNGYREWLNNIPSLTRMETKGVSNNDPL